MILIHSSITHCEVILSTEQYIGSSWQGEVEAVLQIMNDENDMRSAGEKLLQVLQYAAPSVTRLWVFDSAHEYGYKASVASLLGPAMPLFRNLRHIRARWAGDGLDRRHLNCLQDVPMLEDVDVFYQGNADLGPHFPEGLGKLRFLRGLDLSVSRQAARHQTSLCSLPVTVSQLSALTYLNLGRYFDHVETHALLNWTSLRHLSLIENPMKDPTTADWVRYLPTSLVSLTVSGNALIRGGINYAPEGRVQPLLTIPCVSGLHQLTKLSFQFLKGFRLTEWNKKSYLTGLSRLCNLEMSLCGFRAMPNAIMGLSSLRRLCLGGNKLESLPVGQYLRGLEVLILVDNRFSSLPVEALRAATALTCLTMGGNPLAWSAAEAEFVKRIKKFTRSHQNQVFAPRW